MQAEAAKYLWDALQAVGRVQRFSQGKSFDDYPADELLRSAVERQLGIVGEALAQLRKRCPAIAGKVPDLARVVGFRNVLIHAYAAVDDMIVWGVVQGLMGNLQRDLEALLQEQPHPGEPR